MKRKAQVQTQAQTQKCDPCRGTGRADGIGDPRDVYGTATCPACAGRGKVHAAAPDEPKRATGESLADALVAAVEAIVRCGDGREPDGTLEARARRLFAARRAVVEAINKRGE